MQSGNTADAYDCTKPRKPGKYNPYDAAEVSFRPFIILARKLQYSGEKSLNTAGAERRMNNGDIGSKYE